MYMESIFELYNNIQIFGQAGILGIGLFIGIAFAMGFNSKNEVLLAIAVCATTGILAGLMTPIWLPVGLIIFLVLKSYLT